MSDLITDQLPNEQKTKSVILANTKFSPLITGQWKNEPKDNQEKYLTQSVRFNYWSIME